MYLLSKRFRTEAVIGITSITYILCALSSVYYGVLPPAAGRALEFFRFPINIFGGCVYFAVGKYVCENYESVIKVWTKKRSAVLFFLFYALFLAELYASKYLGGRRSSEIAFSTGCIAFFAFLFCLQSDVRVKNALLFRRLSIVIFCGQANVLVMNSFLKKAGLPSVVSYLVSASAVAVICFLVLYVQRTKQWRWAKYLT